MAVERRTTSFQLGASTDAQLDALVELFQGETKSYVVRQAINELHYRMVVLPQLLLASERLESNGSVNEIAQLNEKIARLEAEVRLKQNAIDHYKTIAKQNG